MPQRSPGQAKRKARSQVDAARAFEDFIALGNDRSLRKLADDYVQRGYYKNPMTALSVLGRFSSRDKWQDRIRQASTERAERMLQEAADLDADTFLMSSRLLNERMKYATRDHADAIVKWRESVRKPAPKGNTSVNVKVSVEVRQLAEQMAEKLGISAEELIADAERVAAGAWGDH